MGHKVANCWLLEKNNDIRLSNWKGSKAENTAADDGKLTLMCFNCYNKEGSDSENGHDDNVDNDEMSNVNENDNTEIVNENKMW